MKTLEKNGILSVFSEAFKFKNTRSFVSSHKVLCVMLFVLFCCCSNVFAADDFGVATAMETIINFLTSKWVIGVFFVAFCVECIMLMTAGRADGQAWKKFVPILAGTILFLAGPTITKKFMNTDKLKGAAQTMGLTDSNTSN